MSQPFQRSQKGIILVNSLSGGGAEKVAGVLFDEYRSLGMDVDLVCLERSDVHQVKAPQPDYLSGSSTGRQGLLVKFVELFVLALRLKALVAQRQATFVQSHIYRSNYVNILSKMLGSRHYAQIVNHGIASNYRQEGLKGKTNLALLRWLYPGADELICPSSGMIDDLRKNGVRLPVYRVIGNPFDVGKIRKRAEQDPNESELRLSSQKRYVICVGRLEKVKGFDQALEAFASLRLKDESIELIVLGTGPEGEALRTLARNLGVADRVRFLGHVENPFTYIAHADVLLASSRYEGFSNVIVEALACGTCVVSTDAPSGPREILAPGSSAVRGGYLSAPERARYGVLVGVGEVGQMAEAVSTMLENSELANTYRERGTGRARDFEASRVVRAYLRLGTRKT